MRLRLTWMLALALCAGLSPAAATAQSAPSDFDRGVAARHAGRPAEAVVALERAAQAHADDADVWLNLGLAYSALGRFAPAEAALDRALALSPDYADAQVARARLSYFRGDLAAAQDRLGPVLRRHPEDPEAGELAAQIAAARAAKADWRMDAWGSLGFLSRNLPEASDAGLALARQFGGGKYVVGSVERAAQFGAADIYAEAQLGARLGFLAIGGAPNSHFRPRLALRGEIGPEPWRGGGWSVRPVLDGSWAHYPPGDVRSVAPGFEAARGETWEFGLRWIAVVDEADRTRGGYSLRTKWRPSTPLQLSVAWTDAPEFDELRTVRVKTASLGAAWRVNARTALRLSVDHEMRQAYDRDDVNLGVTRWF